jgi:hypothetical protein
MGKRALWIVLLLTVAAALWPVPENDTVDGAASRSSAPRKRGPALDAPAALQPRSLTQGRSESGADIVDLFPRQSFAPAVVSAAPEKPVAPALPFTYGGRYTEGNNTIVFLKEGEKMRTVRLGDTVNGTYRIEKIDPDAITLNYLPLGQRQTLQTGSVLRP